MNQFDLGLKVNNVTPNRDYPSEAPTLCANCLGSAGGSCAATCGNTCFCGITAACTPTMACTTTVFTTIF